MAEILILVMAFAFSIAVTFWTRKKYTRNRHNNRSVFLREFSLRPRLIGDLERIDIYLTALNDEGSIGQVVKDFKSLSKANRVIVIDNDSSDGTKEQAQMAGAEVIVEREKGYGRVVFRALTEGARGATDWFVICEGDGTFAAKDLNKLIQYADNGFVINGTRIVEQLRDVETQLTNAMFFGNFFAAKILEIKHFGKGTFTDLGTTFKLVNAGIIRKHLNDFDPRINLEFNAHFMDTCLSNDIRMVEVPITFHKRIGKSKGGNQNNLIAIRVGLKMLKGIIFGWKPK